MSTLEHAGQVDKAGAPYILHPLRVTLRLETLDERIADLADNSDLSRLLQVMPKDRVRLETAHSPAH